jgi:hypothetical protein
MKYSDCWKLDLMGYVERLILIFSNQVQNISLVVDPVIRKENKNSKNMKTLKHKTLRIHFMDSKVNTFVDDVIC